MSDEMLRVYEIEELRKYGNRQTIASWLRSGVLAGKKVAGRWWTTRGAVDAFLKGTGPTVAGKGR